MSFDLTVWVDDRVQSSVAPLLAGKPDQNWEKWRVALQSACLKDNKLSLAISKNPNGALLAVVKCAQLGLSPDPALQHFALVPIGNKIEGWVMWRGWVSLAYDTERIVDGSIRAEVIYKQEIREGPLVDMDTQKVNHEPNFLERDDYSDKDILGAYAMAEIVDGPWVSMVLSRQGIDKRLAMGAGTAARQWYPEMCKAKVLGALLRSSKVPLTARTKKLLDNVEEEVETVPVQLVEVETAVAKLPPPVAPDGKPTGAKILFGDLDGNPFPSDEQKLESLVNAIKAEFDRQKIDEETQAALIGGVVAGATLDQLTLDEVQFLLDKITKSEGESE